MLVALWSPKGGSGSSVFAAGCALALAREGPACIVDMVGDQTAVLGLDADPDAGVREWLAIGVEAPVDSLDRLTLEVKPNLTLLPAGRVDLGTALPEAGVALGVALKAWGVPTIVDVGDIASPVGRAVVEVADENVIVVRGCYLALRRAVRAVQQVVPSGAVVVDEPNRALGARDVAEVLGVPVLATVPVHPAIARVVDAGVLVAREPERLLRPARQALKRVGCLERGRAA